MSGRAGEIVTKKRRKKKELWPVGTQQHVCTSEEAHFNAGDEESKNSLARLTPDVLIVLLNILLKCQLACGEWQSDKTDADRGRNPSLTFYNFHSSSQNLPPASNELAEKGHTCPWRSGSTGKAQDSINTMPWPLNGASGYKLYVSTHSLL